MSAFLCSLWPYLLGGLIGWLISGWLARRLKYAEFREKIVEKTVEIKTDNPIHIQRIADLEGEVGEVTGLRSRLVDLEGNADDVVALKNRVAELEGEAGDVAVLISRVADLEGEAEDAVALRSRLTDLEGEVEDVTVLRGRLSAFESTQGAEVARLVPIDLVAAKAAGLKIKNDSDFTVIEGIGPKINDLIHHAGIDTFQALSNVDTSVIQTILDNAGSSFSLAKPQTWPKQADYAANNRWQELKVWQDELDGGV